MILQGAEDDVEGIRDGLGWTVAGAEEQGPLVLTASGCHVALTLILHRNNSWIRSTACNGRQRQ